MERHEFFHGGKMVELKCLSFLSQKPWWLPVFGESQNWNIKYEWQVFWGALIIWSSHDGKMWHHRFCGFRSTCGFGEDAWEIGSLFSSTPNHPFSQSGYMI